MANKLGPYELNSIVTGDARELSKLIPDNSVDLIFTDPVYDRIEDYAWLAETAARVLKDDRACLVFVPTGSLNVILPIVETWLKYKWILDIVMIGPPMLYGFLGVNVQRCLWLEKGNTKQNSIIFDGTVLGSIVNGHKNIRYLKKSNSGWAKRKGGKAHWGKDERAISRWINSFTSEGQIIFDPFTGGGTVPAVCKMLNRQHLAFEIDPETADLARQRVANTQPPLPLVYPEQLLLIAEAKE